jgi:hypothetical protein
MMHAMMIGPPDPRSPGPARPGPAHRALSGEGVARVAIDHRPTPASVAAPAMSPPTGSLPFFDAVAAAGQGTSSAAARRIGLAAYHALLADRVRYFGPVRPPLDLIV